MKIGIGITTYGNRKTPAFEMIRKFTPEAKIVTVNQKGISKAKNMCLALLDDCEHIFLFDDDCYPIVENWFMPYINSKELHLSYTFGRKIINQSGILTEYELPCGCMLYLNKICLDIIGGFDTDFEEYSYEHVNYSQRAYNAELTSAKYLDVTDSYKLIHSMDKHREVLSSLSQTERGAGIQKNRNLFMSKRNSQEWKPYK